MKAWLHYVIFVFVVLAILLALLVSNQVGILDSPYATAAARVYGVEAPYKLFLEGFVRRANGLRGEYRVVNPDARLSGDELLKKRLAVPSELRGSGRKCEGAPTIPVGKTTVVTVATNDGDRTFAVFVPASYTSKRGTGEGNATYTPAPVIILIHGLNDNCERFVQNTGFMEHADADGSIIVSLCGTLGWLGTAFNAGMCCGFTGEKPDELAFVLQALNAIEYPEAGHHRHATGNNAQLCINEEKILTVGFSNGAMLAEVLACRAPTLFRAVASVGGITEPRLGGAEGLAKCTADIQVNNTAQSRPSVLMIHGDADNMVPWGGSSFLGFPSVPDNVDAWVARNGCNASDATSTIDTEFFVNTIYSGCSVAPTAGSVSTTDTSPTRNATVELVRVVGGAHLWPERDGFSTTEHIYTFGEAALGGWD